MDNALKVISDMDNLNKEFDLRLERGDKEVVIRAEVPDAGYTLGFRRCNR
jgi:hypothetical protein